MKREPQSPVARRATQLREAMGFTGHGAQTGFAKFLGVEVATWNNVERGLPLSKGMAFRLMQKCPGIDVQWLWFGHTGGLSLRMAQLLGVLSGHK